MILRRIWDTCFDTNFQKEEYERRLADAEARLESEKNIGRLSGQFYPIPYAIAERDIAKAKYELSRLQS